MVAILFRNPLVSIACTPSPMLAAGDASNDETMEISATIRGESDTSAVRGTRKLAMFQSTNCGGADSEEGENVPRVGEG